MALYYNVTREKVPPTNISRARRALFPRLNDEIGTPEMLVGEIFPLMIIIK